MTTPSVLRDVSKNTSLSYNMSLSYTIPPFQKRDILMCLDKSGFVCGRILFSADISHFKKKEKKPKRGIYIFWEGKRIYCGGTSNLHKRVSNSSREQGFGSAVFTYDETLLRAPDEVWKRLETLCIEALHTIIYGNGLPLLLTNIKDKNILHSTAWNKDEMTFSHLAVEIARSALYYIGIPSFLTTLPDRKVFVFQQGFLERVAEENIKVWCDIIRREIELSGDSSSAVYPPPLLLCRLSSQ